MLESIKGIGKKTAERIVVELKDKLGKWNIGAALGMPSKNSIPEEALQALISLGISAAAAQQALQKAMSLANDDTLKLEELIKLSLKTL
jgi:Holliday junction DNA helicase RuvA